MRPIDADAIKIPSTYVDLFENCRNCKLLDREQVREIIDNTPTIDAESVVRCKDCKYMSKGEEYLWCDHKQGMDLVDANDFCSYGEREGE